MNCNKCGKEIANIQTASCTNFVCKKCGSTEYEIKDKSNGTGIAHGLYCAKCGFWHKWLGKEELKQYATKESKDEIIAKLQSENAALRERLRKAVELPVKVGDTVYFIPTYNGKPIWGVQRGIVQMVGITRQGYHVKIRDRADFNKTYMFRKSAFLSKEQAEARLAELKGGKKE